MFGFTHQSTNSELWCVVNNAASPLVFGEAVWLTRPMVRRQFEVNVIGAWAVSQTFLPHLIKSKGMKVESDFDFEDAFLGLYHNYPCY